MSPLAKRTAAEKLMEKNMESLKKIQWRKRKKIITKRLRQKSSVSGYASGEKARERETSVEYRYSRTLLDRGVVVHAPPAGESQRLLYWP